jgi:hypothetical protein
MTAWAENFSYAYFSRILAAVASDFSLSLFRDAPAALESAATRVAFLRHDVDVDLTRAIRLAQIENRAGIAATYMVMNAGLLYRLNDASSRTALRELIELGHEIGIHFDCPDAVRTDPARVAELEPLIDRACAELAEAAGAPVRSVSFHRPIPALLRGPLLIGDRVNGYADELMGWYLSDSKGSWREGEPLVAFQNPKGRVLQLLIHPIWWGDDHRSPEERLEQFFIERTASLAPAGRMAFDDDLGAMLPAVRRTGRG